jgi:cell division septal protein FtsQ
MFSFRKQSPVRLKEKQKGKAARRIMDPSKRMLMRQLVIGFVLFFVSALILAGVWYGTRLPSLTIATVTVSGGETIDHTVVEAGVQQQLEGAYLGLIPKRFAWWYPLAAVYDAVRMVPRVKDPHVERSSGTELSITFDEYVPFALWCTDRTDADCLFIDETGYAFTAAPKLTGGALVRYHSLGASPKVGDHMTSSEYLQTMSDFMQFVSRDAHFEISSVEFDSADDVFYILAGGGELRATLHDPAAQVFLNLQAILESKEFTHIKPGNFQYIDLRFGSKVFVNEEKVGMASSTDTGTSTVLDGGMASSTR